MNNPPAIFTALVRGTGSIGMRHMRVFRDLVRIRTIAIPKHRDRGLYLLENKYEFSQSLADAVLGKNSLLVVASETACHLEDTLEGIALGCSAILIEKPIMSSLDGVAKLLDSAAKIQDRIFVACNLRFDSALNLFRERLPEIGEIHHVRIEAQSYLPEWRPQRSYRESYSADAAQGGVLRDLIHEIDYAVWLFGKPTAVSALLSNSGRLGIEAEESADLLWRTSSGAVVSIRLDYVTRHYRRLMTAFGSNGELTWDFHAHTVALRISGNAPVTTEVPQDRDEMMKDQALGFIAAAAGRAPGRLATLAEGIFALAICDAARASSNSGCSESIMTEWRMK